VTANLYRARLPRRIALDLVLELAGFFLVGDERYTTEAPTAVDFDELGRFVTRKIKASPENY
jgi:hypothetical protein